MAGPVLFSIRFLSLFAVKETILNKRIAKNAKNVKKCKTGVHLRKIML
jgi:hypothetical protein